MTSFSLTGS